MSNEIEIWKPVKGYEDSYEVSSLGRVKSLSRYSFGEGRQHRKLTEKILKQSPDGKGYLMVWLYNCGKRKTEKVHKLVALSFIENPLHLPEIDHKNANKKDNRVENLRWVTGSQNCNNPLALVKNSVSHYAEKNGNARAVVQYTRNGEKIREWKCLADAERCVGVNHSKISLVCTGKRKSAGGYIWKYKYE